ncbi:MAG TPA: DMT family transporter [Vicinamibacteria bacterium]|nr:DMT family transporter [Vicinamibacteria bacterium]
MSPWLTLALAVACVSFGSILVRFASAPALAVAFYRVGLAAAFIAPLALRPAIASWPRLLPRQRLAVLGSGVSLALHFATWIASLDYTSIAASVLLVNLAPLFTVLLSWLVLGEKVGRPVAGAIALALVGAFLIAAGDWTGGGAAPLKGDLLALVGAAALSAYHVTGRGLRHALPLGAYVQTVWTTAAASLALLLPLAGVPFGPYPPRALAFFVLLALVPTIGGHGLVNRALRHLKAPVVGLFLLGEPIGATLLAWLFFGEVPGRLTLLGGAFVLVALVLVVAQRDA